jgi:hypothetical protein
LGHGLLQLEVQPRFAQASSRHAPTTPAASVRLGLCVLGTGKE